MNQNVLITGATAGIGYELVKIFAKKHYNLILVSEDQQELEKLTGKLQSSNIHVVPLIRDLSSRENAFSLCNEIEQMGISIDIFINDAGQSVFYKFEDTDSEREMDTLNLGISSFVILMKCFVKQMVSKKSGKILNLASVAGKFPGQWYGLSHKTESFVVNYTASMRSQTQGYNVTMTVLVPQQLENNFVSYVDMLPQDHVKPNTKKADLSEMAVDGFNGMMDGDELVISGICPGHLISSRQRNQPYLDGYQGPYEES